MSVQQRATDPHEPARVSCSPHSSAVIGATLAFVVGGAVVAPSFSRREALWLHAGDVPQLDDDTPMPVMLRIARRNGASEVDRRVVYLVKSGDEVRAFDSTCNAPGLPHAVQSGHDADRVSVSWQRTPTSRLDLIPWTSFGSQK